jgi:hypothetical protein
MKLFTFWSFAPLTYIERLCLASMVAVGHEVDLYTVDADIGPVPAGVAVKDAALVLSSDDVCFRPEERPALFADLFRYRGLRKQLGTWVDADMLMLRDLHGLGDHIFGWCTPDRTGRNGVNQAVLRLPPYSPFLAYIDRVASARVPILDHMSMRAKLKQIALGAVGLHKPLGAMRWAALGPTAFTHYVRRNGMQDLAQPADVFYPVPVADSRALFEAPAAAVRGRLTERTRAIHLWRSSSGSRNSQPAPGSFIAEMCEHYGMGADLPATLRQR